MKSHLLLVLCSAACALVFSSSARAQENPFLPTEENSWAFPTEADVDARGPIDLRSLNETQAGEHGFIRLSEDKRGFVRGDGKPIRFWATHSTNIKRMEEEQVRQYCRFLARMGVNLGLAGSALQPAPDQPDINKTHPGKLDETWRMVAAFKEQGIYSEIRGTWFYGGFAKVTGIDGYKARDGMAGVVFFSPKLQEAYKAWMKDLLTQENPYTGMALKDDPALAMITFFNEDTLLFYTFGSLRGKPLANAQSRFARWASDKYGSLEKAMEAWGGRKAEGDDLQAKRLGFLSWWFAGTEGRKEMPNPKRLQDQMVFAAKVQREYYASMKRWLREDLGCRQLVMTSNFRPAIPPLMQDLENWVKAAGDVVILNSYPGAVNHYGPKRGYMVQAGDIFQSISMTHRPLELAQAHRQVAGHPFMVSETLWANPSEYTNESALLHAIYTNVPNMAGSSFAGPRNIGFGGSKGYFYPFGNQGKGFPIQKWNSSEPGHLLGYPAAALIARRGYGMQKEPAVLEHRPFEDLVSLEMPLLPEGLDFDPLYADDSPDAGQAKSQSKVPPEAFLMGPVLVEFSQGEDRIAKAVRDYDRSDPVVTSLDGSVRCERSKGLVTLDVPEAQVAVGFLGSAGAVKLSDVTVKSSNEHIGIAVVSLDGQPIARSARLLVQITPRSRPTGWKVEAATHEDKKKNKTIQGWKILSTGKMPYRVENIQGELRIGNARLKTLKILNPAGGVRQSRDLAVGDDGAIRLELLPDAPWLLLE